jgi:PhnB protein
MAVNKMYPRLVVSDGARAIDFYIAALGATETARYSSPEGKIVHAELQIGPATLAVKDADEFDPAPST